MSYALLKTLHVSCAITSYALFWLRGVRMLRSTASQPPRWLKIVPHLVDTLLLASAIGLAITLEQYPLVNAWLTAKFFALLLYIALGSVALKTGTTRTVRRNAWLAAQMVFGYIVLVALNHDPLLP